MFIDSSSSTQLNGRLKQLTSQNSPTFISENNERFPVRKATISLRKKKLLLSKIAERGMSKGDLWKSDIKSPMLPNVQNLLNPHKSVVDQRKLFISF